MIDFALLRAEVAIHPYRLLFATVSGAHLYGFPSPDSDYDLRGAHILPASEAVGLLPKRETLEVAGNRGALEMDLVTHDVLKFFTMLLKRNGYVLEQLYSPLVIQSSPEHVELKRIARGCITRHHSHHYLGFATSQWDLFRKENPPRVKPLLYVYRVLLTGIHLMRTGKIESNLIALINRKITGVENSALELPEFEFHHSEYMRLTGQLEAAAIKSTLQEEASCRDALHELLVRIRLPNL
jgi:hypothetical protein